jgi:hypothetical protein
MALRAAVLPILISAKATVIPRETNSEDIGISLGRTAGARRFEKGTPLFRAKDQSWRDAVASTAIQLPVRLMIMIDTMAFVAAYDFVALKNNSMKGYPVLLWRNSSRGPAVKILHGRY